MSAAHSRASLAASGAASRHSSPSVSAAGTGDMNRSPSKLGLGAAASALRPPLDPRLAYTVWPGRSPQVGDSTEAASASSSSSGNPPPLVHLRLSHELFDDLVARYSEPGLSVSLRVEGDAAALQIGNVSHPLAHSQEPTLHDIYQVSPPNASSSSSSSEASPWLRRLGQVKDRYSVLADARSASAAATRLRERREEEEARKKGNRTVLLESAEAKAKKSVGVASSSKTAALPRRVGNGISPTKPMASPAPSSIGRDQKEKERTALGGTRVDLRTARDPETAPMPARLIHLLAPGPMARRSIVASLRQPEPSVVALLNQFAHSPASVQPPPDAEAKAATKKYKGPVNRRLSAQAARNSAAGSGGSDVSPPRAGPGTVYVLRDESYRLVRFEWAAWDKAARRAASEKAEEAYDRLGLPRDAAERRDLFPDGRPTKEEKEMEKRKARSKEEEAKLDDGGELSEDVEESPARPARAEVPNLKGLGLIDDDDSNNMSGFESSTSAHMTPSASSGGAKSKKTSSAHDRLKKAAIGRGPTPAERAKQAEKLRLKQLKAEGSGNGSSTSSSTNGSSASSAASSIAGAPMGGGATTRGKKASASGAEKRDKEKDKGDEAALAALGGSKRGVPIDAVPWVPGEDKEKEASPPAGRGSSRRKAGESSAPPTAVPAADGTANKRGTKRRSSVGLDKEQQAQASGKAPAASREKAASTSAGKRPASSASATRNGPMLARHLDYTDSEEEKEEEERETKRRRGGESEGSSQSPEKVAATKSATVPSSGKPTTTQGPKQTSAATTTAAAERANAVRHGVGTGAPSSSEPWLSIRNDADWTALAERFGKVYDEYARMRARIEREGEMLRAEAGRVEAEGKGAKGRGGEGEREEGEAEEGEVGSAGTKKNGETLRWRAKVEGGEGGKQKAPEARPSSHRKEGDAGADDEDESQGPMAYEELERTVQRTEQVRAQLERMKAALVEYKERRGEGAAGRRR